MRPVRTETVLLALLAAPLLAGCGTSGYGTVDTQQLVLIPTARPAAARARQADTALVCGARAEARRLHRGLRVERPQADSPSAQIAVVNAVTAEKPGGVLIAPVARNAMLAPILSMRRAGIRVIRVSPPDDPRTAASEGARDVAAAVRAIQGHGHGAGISAAVSLLAPCASAR
jgi:ribose transport system substrate-binding protein